MKRWTNIAIVVILAVSAAPVSIQGAKVAKCEVRVFDITARPVADAEIAAFEVAYHSASRGTHTKPLVAVEPMTQVGRFCSLPPRT